MRKSIAICVMLANLFVGASYAQEAIIIKTTVVGPTSATSGDVATFNGTSGQIIQDGSVLLSSLAPKASPSFSGTVTMPDASTWTSTGIANLTSIAVLSGAVSMSGAISAPAWATSGLVFIQNAATYTDTSTAMNGTVATAYIDAIAAPTIASTNTGITYTDVSTFHVSRPVAGTNVTTTNKYAIDSSGTIRVIEASTGYTTLSANGQAAIGASTAGGAFINGLGSSTDLTLAGSAGNALSIPHGTVNLTTGGTLTITTLSTANGSYVCATAGLLSVEAAACPVSDKDQKNPLAWLDAALAEDKILHLRAAVYTYKNKKQYGAQVHVGLYAQDVEKMDRRCVVYNQKGKIQNWDPNCVIAYLVAANSNLEGRVVRLERSRHGL